MRDARLDAPEALHHVIVRGIERRKIVDNEAEKNDRIEPDQRIWSVFS